MIYCYFEEERSILVVAASDVLSEMVAWAQDAIKDDGFKTSKVNFHFAIDSWKEFKVPVYYKPFEDEEAAVEYAKSESLTFTNYNTAASHHYEMIMLSSDEDEITDHRTIGEKMEQDLNMGPLNDPFDTRTPEEILNSTKTDELRKSHRDSMTGESFGNVQKRKGHNEKLEVDGVIEDGDNISVRARKRGITGISNVFSPTTTQKLDKKSVHPSRDLPEGWYVSLDPERTKERDIPTFVIVACDQWEKNHAYDSISNKHQQMISSQLSDDWNFVDEHTLEFTGIEYMSMRQRCAQAEIDLKLAKFKIHEECVEYFVKCDIEQLQKFVEKASKKLEEAGASQQEIDDLFIDISDDFTITQMRKIVSDANELALKYTPQPHPGDYVFDMNQRLTKLNSMAGAETPVFIFKVKKDGPSQGKFSLDDVGILLETHPNFEMISRGIWCFEDREITGDVLQQQSMDLLLNAGFIHDPIKIADNSAIQKKIAKIKNNLGRELTLDEVRLGLQGDGTTTMPGTGSYGKVAIGYEPRSKENFGMGIIGDRSAVYAIDHNAKTVDVNSLPENVKKIYASIIGTNDVVYNEFLGNKIAQDLYVIPLGVNDNVDDNTCYNVREVSHSSFNGTRCMVFKVFNEDKDAFVSGDINGTPFILRLHQGKDDGS